MAGANLCGLGIEDWSIGMAKAAQAQAALKANGLQAPKNVPRFPDWSALQDWTTDYVEITSDILPSNDPYWNLPQACWDIPGTDLADGGNMPKTSTSSQRYNLCQATFGAPGSNPDQNVTRDAPILEAYTDHLKVGRFGGFPSQLETTMNRRVDPGLGTRTIRSFLKLITCCFNKQATFKVRAGGEWVAVGQQGVGLLNHVKADSNNRCVLSCDPQDSLLNARSFDVPWAPVALHDSRGRRPSEHAPVDRAQQPARDAQPDVLVRDVERLRIADDARRPRPHPHRARPDVEVLGRQRILAAHDLAERGERGLGEPAVDALHQLSRSARRRRRRAAGARPHQSQHGGLLDELLLSQRLDVVEVLVVQGAYAIGRLLEDVLEAVIEEDEVTVPRVTHVDRLGAGLFDAHEGRRELQVALLHRLGRLAEEGLDSSIGWTTVHDSAKTALDPRVRWSV